MSTEVQEGESRTTPETEIRYRRRSPEEVAQLAVGRRPFSYEDWQRKAPPATVEELAEMEEFLRERHAEREANLEREAGLEAPG